MTADTIALELREIVKRYGTLAAVDGASVTVRRGAIHVVLGENGAGKTTLLRIAAGMTKPDSGEILLDGEVRRWRSPVDARSAGVGVVQQHFSLVPAMTVAETVALTRDPWWSGYSASRAIASVRALAVDSGLDVDPTAVVATLPVAAQQRTEIVKAIAHGPRLLMLDETTSVLTPSEAVAFYSWLRRYVSAGRTALVITHRIREAMTFADSVTVLRNGRTTLSGEVGEFAESQILDAMLGSGAAPAPPERPAPSHRDAPRWAIDRVSLADDEGRVRLRDVSLEVRPGEIVGVAGVDGAGQHELLRVLAGRVRPTTGRTIVPQHVGFIPEDRLRDAIIGSMSLAENTALRGAGSRRGVVDWDAISAATREVINGFQVRTTGVGVPASSLSGGNQQRYVVGRELADSPEAIVAENPTRGLDIRASKFVLEQLTLAARSGAAVVLYSSDLDELVSVSDRAVVCFGGAVKEVPVSTAAMGAAMVGTP